MEFINKIIKEFGFSSAYPLKESGSGCRFYRIKDSNKSAILLLVDGKHKDISSYVEISSFLRRIGVGVPEIYYYDDKIIVEEDLGDFTLQNYILETKDFNIYKKVIDELLLMQVTGDKKLQECKCLTDRIFDYNTFRWETWYFSRYFLEHYCGIVVPVSLHQEFHKLALSLVEEKLYFMHRDFQSQNILIKDGRIRVVDFQGTHRGLLAYDLSSLLKDAYVEIDDDTREELINYYLHCLNNKWGIAVDASYFRRIFLHCGLQRNMQALGAFAYLSSVKNKQEFAQYIPMAVGYLLNGLVQTNNFPELLEIVKNVK